MTHWGGLNCCIGAVAFYLLSRQTGRAVEFLKSATRVYHLKDLAKLFEVEGEVYPLIIAVSGKVGSETPLKCEQSGILSVLIEETAEEQFLKRNWKFSWVRDCALMKPTSKEVPWYLDDGTGRVNVVGAKDAIKFRLPVGSDVFEKSEPSSLIRGTLDYLKGFKMLGIRRIERVLPINTPLTIVGEAIKDSTGNVKIQKPEQGPFYVSPIPLDELISKVGTWSRRFKYASIGLTVLGVILISKPVIEVILERRQQKRAGEEAVRRLELAREAERHLENSYGGTSRYNSAPRRASTRGEPVTRRTEPVTTRAEPVTTRAEPVTTRVEPARRTEAVSRGLQRQYVNSSDRTSREPAAVRSRAVEAASRRAEQATRELEMQHENSSDVTTRDGSDILLDSEVADRCVICLTEKYNAAFVPCGHLCCCITCSSQTMMRVRTCPLCRTRIDQVLKIYRH